MVTGINESRTLTKHTSCKWQYKFDSEKCNLNQKRNDNKCWFECKNPKEHRMCKKIIFGFLQHVVAKMINITGDSVVICNEFIEETKVFQQNALQQIFTFY